MALKRKVEAVFGQTLHHGYGLSEYAGSLHATRLGESRVDASAGYAFAGALFVVGRKEDDGNEAVIAFVVPDRANPPDMAALRRHLSTQLAPCKRPARILPSTNCR